MKKISLTIILVIILIAIIAAIYLFSQQNKMTLTANLNQSNQPEKGQTQPTNSYDIQGMKVEVLQEGAGEAAAVGNTVSVHYVGTLQNGTKFDSSIDRGEPFSFTLGENRVIQGWELGVLGMKVGEKRRLTIPSDLAYGNQAVGGVIPANATLIFEVELIGIK